MSGFGEDGQGFYSGSYDNQAQGVYDMGSAEFPQDTQFAQFDYNQSPGNAGSYPDSGGYYAPPSQASPYTGSIMTPDSAPAYNNTATEEDYENEPPLLEELGINFDHIYQKTLAVLNPLKSADVSIMQDTDLAGPLCFCMAFGGTLLLAGKVHFGYIYGLGVVGCFAMYALLNLMSLTGVSASQIVSILGYCLLPMVILSAVAIIFSLQGLVGVILTGLSVMWCSVSASKLFVSALAMDHQQLLVAYPCALVYGVFALLTVF